MAKRVMIGSIVRLKKSVAKPHRFRQSTVVRGFLGPGIPGGVVLAERLDDMRYWNAADLEVVTKDMLRSSIRSIKSRK